jgi:hypothetical protein
LGFICPTAQLTVDQLHPEQPVRDLGSLRERVVSKPTAPGSLRSPRIENPHNSVVLKRFETFREFARQFPEKMSGRHGPKKT